MLQTERIGFVYKRKEMTGDATNVPYLEKELNKWIDAIEASGYMIIQRHDFNSLYAELEKLRLQSSDHPGSSDGKRM